MQNVTYFANVSTCACVAVFECVWYTLIFSFLTQKLRVLLWTVSGTSWAHSMATENFHVHCYSCRVCARWHSRMYSNRPSWWAGGDLISGLLNKVSCGYDFIVQRPEHLHGTYPGVGRAHRVKTHSVSPDTAKFLPSGLTPIFTPTSNVFCFGHDNFKIFTS